MVTFGVWNFITSGTASPRTGSWHIEILRDTSVYDCGEDLFFRFSEGRIPEMMSFYLAISEKNAVLPGSKFREIGDVFPAKRCCYDLSF